MDWLIVARPCLEKRFYMPLLHTAYLIPEVAAFFSIGAILIGLDLHLKIICD